MVDPGETENKKLMIGLSLFMGLFGVFGGIYLISNGIKNITSSFMIIMGIFFLGLSILEYRNRKQ